MPRDMRVPKTHDIARTRAKRCTHLGEEGVGPVAMHVDRVERVIPVHQRHGRASEMTAKRPEIDTKGEAAEKFLCARGDVRARPRVREVGQLLLPRILVLAAAM